MYSVEFLINLIIDYNSLIRLAATELGISSSQAFNILSIPFDGISMSGLSHKLGLDASTLTRNVNKLIKLDYMIKKSNNYDKRVQTVILTKRGHILKESLYDKINDLNYKATNQLSIDEKEIIHLSIEKLAWALECNRENN